MSEDPPELRDVVGAIEAELKEPSTRRASRPDRPAEVVRSLIAEFRREPVGGWLLLPKRIAFWLTASAFDRQTKILEALLEAVEDLESRVEEVEARRRDR